MRRNSVNSVRIRVNNIEEVKAEIKEAEYKELIVKDEKKDEDVELHYDSELSHKESYKALYIVVVFVLILIAYLILKSK